MGERAATDTQFKRRIIERPRLTRLLDTSQGRLKVLVAPAGYGKTTLVRQWLVDKRATWYTGTQASTDVAALAAGIRAAVGAFVPGSGDALMERLPVTPRPEEEADVLAGMLAVDLLEWPRDAWLVFDDYQAIAGTPPSERFVEALLLEAPLNLIVMSRRKPTWASSRRVLYGELFELDREALAMTDAEAGELLAGTGRDAKELVELAQGWPAVLGLAAMSSSPPPELTATPHLYGFFAEEIYQRIDPGIRRALSELALYDVGGRRLALQELRPDDAQRVVEVGVDSGFLTESADGRLDMHPLLRSFLERKLEEENPDVKRSIVSAAVQNMIENSMWDEAVQIAQRHQPALIEQLLPLALEPLLSSGRANTLARWLSDVPRESPAARVLSAELAFSEGRFYESEALAALVSNDPEAAKPLSVRARLIAGRAAHAASREIEAANHYRAARDAADTVDHKRLAAFGELGAAIEIESDEAHTLIEALGPVERLEPEERVVFTCRLLNLETRFGLPVSLEQGRTARQLLRLVRDPIARCSFRNVFGYTLGAMGHFKEAEELSDEQLEDAERHRLDFVIPYAQIVQALVELGQHTYVKAEELLNEAEERALGAGDRTAYNIAWAVRTRLYSAQGAFDLALSRALDPAESTTKSLRAELASAYAVALAAVGEGRRARRLAVQARQESKCIEAAVSSEAAEAIAELRDAAHGAALDHARAALAAAVRSGMIETFVSAYRGYPELVTCLLEDPTTHDELLRILTIAGDAREMAPDVIPSERSIHSLSKREKEVLALLAQGMTNPEIGQALFISPVTVKVHVRHIFEKLGVRSRAAAAARAVQLNRD
jgi:LuxR family transcriptional regulator, maltose regulon positive regulatory protein